MIEALKNKIYLGRAEELIRNVPDKSIDAIITSLPNLNLKDYGVEGQLGNESAFNVYIQRLFEI